MSSIRSDRAPSPAPVSHTTEPATPPTTAANNADTLAPVRATKRKAEVTPEQPRKAVKLDPATMLPPELFLQTLVETKDPYHLLSVVSRLNKVYQGHVLALNGRALRSLLPPCLHGFIAEKTTLADLTELLSMPHGRWGAGYAVGSGNAGYAPVFTSSGDGMIATSRSANVNVWRCENNQLNYRGALGGTWDASCAVFSRDDKLIATAGGMHRHLKFFELESLRCLGTLEDFADRVVFLNGTTVAAEQGATGTMRIVRVPTKEGEQPVILRSLDVAHEIPMQNGRRPTPHCTVSPDGKYLAAGAGTNLHVWAIAELVQDRGAAEPPALAPSTRGDGHAHPIEAIAFAPEGDKLTTMDDQNVLRFWQVAPDASAVEHQGTLETTPPSRGTNYNAALVYDPSSKHVAATLGGGTFALVRNPGHAPERFAQLNGLGPLFSLDGRFVTAIVGAPYYDRNATVWRLGTKEARRINHLEGRQPASSLVASPNGRLIVATDPTCCGMGVWTYQGKKLADAGVAPSSTRLQRDDVLHDALAADVLYDFMDVAQRRETSEHLLQLTTALEAIAARARPRRSRQLFERLRNAWGHDLP